MPDHNHTDDHSHHGPHKDIYGFVICVSFLLIAAYLVYGDITGDTSEPSLRSVIGVILGSAGLIYSKLEQIRYALVSARKY